MWLVSACLLGISCRYDGNHSLDPALVAKLVTKTNTSGPAEGPPAAGAPDPPDHAPRGWIPVCPEQLGGLPTPRPPAEIEGGTGHDVLAGRARVVTRADQPGEVTPAFLRGAYATLQLARLAQVRGAILKEKSPSCGVHLIYDGTFQGRLRAGPGVTAALLQKEDITVLTAEEFVRGGRA